VVAVVETMAVVVAVVAATALTLALLVVGVTPKTL
jgi:hypothetical protein